MKILVVGTGTIGHPLTQKLKQLSDVLGTKDEIITLNRSKTNVGHTNYLVDLVHEDWVQGFFARVKPDIIYYTGGVANPRTDPHELVRINIEGTLNLLKHCPTCRFYFASSIVVYGNRRSPNELSPMQPTSIYGITKATGEDLVNYYTQLKGLKSTIVRLGATVGPILKHGLIYDIIQKLKSDSEFLELWGNAPGSKKSYTHVDDVITGLLTLHEGTFNLCRDSVLSVEQIANIIMEELQIKKEIQWSGHTNPGDNQYLSANNFKSISNGLVYKYTPEQAIRSVCEHFK